jgi:hypothetical protein
MALRPRQELVDQLVRRFGSPAKAAEVIREYRRAFGSVRGEATAAVKDLRMFCGMAGTVPVDPLDPHGRGLERTEGRREVWHRIELMLSIDPEEVEAAKSSNPQGDDA